MSRVLLILILGLSYVFNLCAQERELIWPKNKMPNPQEQQIALMTDELKSLKPNARKNQIAYLEWFEKPAKDINNKGCMILISGGAYNSCCDVHLIKLWREKFTALGFQCVNFVYRTPRPVGIPFYQSAWEDGQRAVRMVRSEAKKRGFDPERIGTISMSAGSHLALLLATSSQTPAYTKVDKIDEVPCHINWAIVNAPAYITTDAALGTPATRQGYGVDVKLVDILKFDEKTCPMSLHHGGNDIYSPNGSTMVYQELRKRNIPAELHLYPGKGHGAYGLDRAVEFMTQMGYIGSLPASEKLMARFNQDNSRSKLIKEDVWPENKTPDFQENQNKPYIEWHFPKVMKTKAIQIIYSGGAYMRNNPDEFEVAPTRRYLNDLGITVVTLKYRSPRPSKESGLAKHTNAWQDLQRTIRIVRSEAKEKGLDPDQIGIMGCSAGGHLTMMGLTSSLQQSYLPIDQIDKIPCNVQWGICIYPAYLLSDGTDGFNSTGGNDNNSILVPELNFDLKTAPALFLHGDSDGYAAMNSVKSWEKMRSMGIQSELHTLAKRKHCFQNEATPGTGSYNFLDRIGEFLKDRIH